MEKIWKNGRKRSSRWTTTIPPIEPSWTWKDLNAGSAHSSPVINLFLRPSKPSDINCSGGLLPPVMSQVSGLSAGIDRPLSPLAQGGGTNELLIILRCL